MKEYFIYRIINPKGKVYIGQTANPKKRPLDYRWCGGTMNKQILICRSIKKYRYENHIIDVCIDRYNKSQVNAEEIRLIKYYKSLGISLNITDGGATSSHLRRRKVLKFDTSGNFIEEYKSVKEAADSVKCESWNLCTAMTAKLYYSKGFLWIHKDDYENGERPIWIAGKTGKSTLKKVIHQFDLDGNYLNTFESAEEAGRQTGIISTNISANARGEVKRSKEFIFSYNKEVEKYNLIKYKQIRKRK